MPLFKRRDPAGRPEDELSPPATRVLGQQDILDRIEEEMFRAERYGRPLAVLCALPQRLPNEAPERQEMLRAADAVTAQLRFSDRVGTLEDGTLVAVLPETPADVARVISHRIVADLAIRGAGASHVKWFVGVSTYPDDGSDPPSMVVAALKRAQS
jgi:hypothetical protein